MISKKRVLTVLLVLFVVVCCSFSFISCKNKEESKSISSMSVIYEQGDSIVYPDTTFDELKRTIVVSVKYTDGTEEIVTDYTITGTMTVGDTVLTISYKNFTKTIKVSVSEKTDEPHSHVFTRYPAHAATCTENGNIEYWYCSSCGKFYSDQNGDNEILQSNTVTLAAHTPVIDGAVAATCTKTGLTEGKHCSVCNEVIVAQEITDALGHSFINYVSNNDATCTKDGTKTAKCDRCDERETTIDVDSKLGHNLVHHEAQSATCTENGWNTYDTCSRCDYTTYKEILALGHTEIIDKAVAATCTETGLTEGKHCSVCNEVIVAQEVTGALGHSFINYISNDDATCVKDGTKTAKCDRCDERKTIIDVDSKLGHDLVPHEAQSATCMENGWSSYDTCSRCDYTSYKEIPALGHTEVVDKAVAATCTKTGLTEGKHCSVCNEVLIVQEVTNALGHNLVHHEGQTSTCTENGWNTYDTCSRCDYTTYKEIPATGHTEVVDKAVAATCTETGLTEGKHCSACNEVIVAQEVTEALGHSYTNYVSNDDATCIKDGTKTAKCDRCDERKTIIDINSKLGHDLVHHEGQVATCTVNGWNVYDTCSRCDYTTYKEIPALGHTKVIDKAIAATCTKTGLTEGMHCSVCSEVLVVQEVTNALGHSVISHEAQSATCTVKGWNAYDTCSRCDYTTYKEIPALGHTEVIDKAVAATCTKTGLTEGRHCSVCGEVLIVQEVTNALGHSLIHHEAIAATCKRNGNIEYWSCSLCNKDYFDANATIEVDNIVTTTNVHSYPEDFVKENIVAYSGNSTGTYEENKYCDICGKLLSSKTVTLPLITVYENDTGNLGMTNLTDIEILNSNIVGLSSSGVLTPKSAGKTIVTASADGENVSYIVLVLNDYLSASISASTLYVTQTATINVSASRGSYSFRSSNTSVATVSSSGTVKAVGSGSATITITGTNGKTATKYITVKANSITISQSSVSITKGSTCSLSVKTTISDSITWSSSNTSVVQVSSNGKLTGVGEGTATVTAKSNKCGSVTCYVTVKSNTITLTKSNYSNYITVSVSCPKTFTDLGYQYWTYKIVITVKAGYTISENITVEFTENGKTIYAYLYAGKTTQTTTGNSYYYSSYYFPSGPKLSVSYITRVSGSVTK